MRETFAQRFAKQRERRRKRKSSTEPLPTIKLSKEDKQKIVEMLRQKEH